MRLYVEGEKSVGLCDSCGGKVKTTMTRREYSEEGLSVPVPDVLLALCDSCGSVAGIPHQSTAKINAHRKPSKAKGRAIGVRISGDLEDAFYLVVSTIGGPTRLVQSHLLRFYLNQAAELPEVASKLKECSASFPAPAAGGSVIHVRVSVSQDVAAKRTAKAVGIKQSDLLRGVVLLAAEDGGISYKDIRGQVVKPNPDAAGKQRFATMQAMARVLA